LVGEKFARDCVHRHSVITYIDSRENCQETAFMGPIPPYSQPASILWKPGKATEILWR
jgi:hypothetical protein